MSMTISFFLHKSILLYILILTWCIAVALTKEQRQEHAEDDKTQRSKRSNWNKANGLWGKRSASYHPDFWGFTMKKRPGNEWGKLNSLWGKRSSWDSATGLWGKRSIDETGIYEYNKK